MSCSLARTLPGADDEWVTVDKEGNVLMSKSAINRLGLPMGTFECIHNASEDSKGGILYKLVPNLSALRAHYQNQPSASSAMPSASGPPTASQPPAAVASMKPSKSHAEAGALCDSCLQEELIVALQEQTHNGQEAQELPRQCYSGLAAPGAPPMPPPSSSVPAAAVPKMRATPKAPALQTVILPLCCTDVS